MNKKAGNEVRSQAVAAPSQPVAVKTQPSQESAGPSRLSQATPRGKLKAMAITAASPGRKRKTSGRITNINLGKRILTKDGSGGSGKPCEIE